jgi:hypothetical protein
MSVELLSYSIPPFPLLPWTFLVCGRVQSGPTWSGENNNNNSSNNNKPWNLPASLAGGVTVLHHCFMV